MTIRVFRPLTADHPCVGGPCARCNFPLRAGERTVLIPKFETQEGYTVEADACHATCALAGLKTKKGTIQRIKDGDGSPYPVILIDGPEATLEECGLEQ